MDTAAMPEALRVKSLYPLVEKSAYAIAVAKAVEPKLSKSPEAKLVFEAGAEEYIFISGVILRLSCLDFP